MRQAKLIVEGEAAVWLPRNQSGRTLLLRRSKDDLTRMKEIENIASKREGGGREGGET